MDEEKEEGSGLPLLAHFYPLFTSSRLNREREREKERERERESSRNHVVRGRSGTKNTIGAGRRWPAGMGIDHGVRIYIDVCFLI
jgi:hypothetical protein